MENGIELENEPLNHAHTDGVTEVAFDHVQNKHAVKRRYRVLSALRKNIFLISVLSCAVIGFAVGLGLRNISVSESALMWLALPGEIFMRTLSLMILPLLVASIITGSADIDPKTNGKMTAATIFYMLLMNGLGVLIGMTMFYIIGPHKAFTAPTAGPNDCFNNDVKLSTGDIFADLIRNIFPDNLVTACFQKTQTKYTQVPTGLNCNRNTTDREYIRTVGSSNGINVLGIIVLCTAVGIASGKVGERARPFIAFFSGACDVILLMLNWVIWLTPVGCLSLIATSIAKAENIESTFKSLAVFVLTVLAAILVLVFVLVPVLFFVFMRQNPFKFLFNALRPMMAGFGPPSSAIAIPEVINVAENVYGVPPVISRFCSLFGAAMSRCGSGSFIIVCSLFLASLDGIVLNAGQVVYSVVLTTAVTFAVPAVPSSSVICVIIILSSLSVAPTNIGIIMALEWFLDRARATANVLVSLLGNILINKLIG